MVTNTAGTATDLPATQENGNCRKTTDISDVNKSPIQNPTKDVTSNLLENTQNNDPSTAMSQETITDTSNFSQALSGNAIAENTYTAKGYGNGLSALSNTNMNEPHQNFCVPHSNYNSYNSQGYPRKPGPSQPLPSGVQNYSSSMQPTYLANQQSVSAPTLNQLLTTPTRHPSQYSGYGSQANHQSHSEYKQQGHQQSWLSKTQTERTILEHPKGDISSFTPRQPFAGPQHSSYPPRYSRYPTPAGSQPQHVYSQQQFNNNPIQQPAGQAVFAPSSPASARHPVYTSQHGYSNIQGNSPYYAHHTQQGYPEQHPGPQPNDMQYQLAKEDMMSPKQGPLQSSLHSAHPGRVLSPMSAAPVIGHPIHSSVSQFRGPPSTPGSPSIASQPRTTPLSPPSVRSDSSLHQYPMRPASGHSEHSNPPVPSPVPGGSNFGNYRTHPNQHATFGWQPHNYPQGHPMLSSQQQPLYPNNQSHAVQGTTAMRSPNVGKPNQPVSQPYSHSQVNPAFPQSGYSSASPAPTERRPSRQGSHPSVCHTPESNSNSRPGAAAAAAAALAAAAHTAQPVVVNQRPPTPNYYPQSQQQHLQHPNYVASSGGLDTSHQNFPRMFHSSGPTSVQPPRAFCPTGMVPPTQPNHRMPPPSHFPPGYAQHSVVAVPHQEPYPGYPATAEIQQVSAPNPVYQPKPSQQQPSHPQEEAPKKSGGTKTARSSSQKLAALFEPSDEPGRRQFIENVLQYWEDKDVPLKNSPMMGGKTLDLFRLYNVVKHMGGMVEVTRGKKWPEISNTLNLGSASTSGFTLKKQYCKYLYGYECKVEKGIPEPQEAMARITEANRKRKQQLQESSKEDPHLSVIRPGPPVLQSHPPVNSFTSQHYPASDYPHTENHPYPLPPSLSTQGYVIHSPSGPMTSGNFPQHAYNNNGMQPVPPQIATPHMAPYRNVPPNAASSWPRSMSGPRPPPHCHPSTNLPHVPWNNDTSKTFETGSKQLQPQQQSFDSRSCAPNVDLMSSMRPPLPASGAIAAANPFNDLQTSNQSTSNALPISYGHPRYSNPPDLSRTSQEQLQGSRPSMMPTYPYSYSPLPHPSSHLTPTLQSETHNPLSPTPRFSTYQSGHSQGPRPQVIDSPAYTPSGAVVNVYPGVKRRLRNSCGPPRKLIRQETPLPYSQNHTMYTPNSEVRHRFPPSDTTYRTPPPGLPVPGTPHSRLQPPIISHRFQRMPNRGTAYSRLAGKKRQPRSPLAVSSHGHKYALDPKHNLKRHLQMSRPYPHLFKREAPMFPPGSVEATQLKLTKYHRKTCQDVGLTESWRLIMSLKSGLLAESTWAINAINVLLFDQRSVAQFRMNQLPGLLDSLVEHFRRYLSEIFYFSSELESLGLFSCFDEAESDTSDTDVFDTEEMCIINRARQWRTKRKVSKFKNKNATYDIKVEQRSDTFLLDSSEQWDKKITIKMADHLDHIIPSLLRSPFVRKELSDKNEEQKEEDVIFVPCVEATLGDVLSIPSSVLSPDDFIFTESNSCSDESKTNNGSDIKCSDELNSTKLSKCEKTDSNDASDLNCVIIKSTDEINSSEIIKKHVQEASSIEKIKEALPETDHGVFNEQKALHDKTVPTNAKKFHLRNGLQTDFALRDEMENKTIVNPTAKNKEESVSPVEAKDNIKVLDKDESSEESNHFTDMSLTAKVKQILKQRNVILLEDESNGIDGSLSDALSGPLLCPKESFSYRELSNRLLSISNILRSLSFIPANVEDLVKQNNLMKSLSGILLLRHKHKLRKRMDLITVSDKQPENFRSDEDSKAMHVDLDQIDNKRRSDSSGAKLNSVTFRRSKSLRKSHSNDSTENEAKEITVSATKCTNRDHSSCISSSRKKMLFSSIVLNEKENIENPYDDPWWWDCVRSLREDALVVLANISSYLDLSSIPDDHVPLAILEACLHWTLCPSSDACDTLSNKQREFLSAQRLSVEILSKLSIKEQNVDLILATRPYSRIEKLFLFLIDSIGDRKDPVLREFSIVLLANLSAVDPCAARAITLQKNSISNILSFLEECEETGPNKSQSFRHQSIDFGTPLFMMVKAARTLHAMAVITENKPSFMVHQLRLLSLSMSQILEPPVTSIISSLLFELSHETT